MTIFRWSLAALLVVLAGIALSDAAFAITLTVNSLFDVVAAAPLDNGVCETALGNGVCTLRAAMMKANQAGSAAPVPLPDNLAIHGCGNPRIEPKRPLVYTFPAGSTKPLPVGDNLARLPRIWPPIWS